MIEAFFSSLQRSLNCAHADGILDSAVVHLRQNCVNEIDTAYASVGQIRKWFRWPVDVQLGIANLGYGAGNNQVINALPQRRDKEAVLVINPDVWLEDDGIGNALRRLDIESRCGLICGRLMAWENDDPRWGLRRYPSALVLLVRQFRFLAFSPPLRKLNERYECRDYDSHAVKRGVELCTGSFMLGSRSFFKDLGGFDPGYFMYFEDYDLSLRGLKRGWVNVYDPGVRVHHAGGFTSKKDFKHKLWFIASAVRFFRKHGWRLFRVGCRPDATKED